VSHSPTGSDARVGDRMTDHRNTNGGNVAGSHQQQIDTDSDPKTQAATPLLLANALQVHIDRALHAARILRHVTSGPANVRVDACIADLERAGEAAKHARTSMLAGSSALTRGDALALTIEEARGLAQRWAWEGRVGSTGEAMTEALHALADRGLA